MGQAEGGPLHDERTAALGTVPGGAQVGIMELWYSDFGREAEKDIREIRKE